MSEKEQKIRGFSLIGEILNQEFSKTGLDSKIQEHKAVLDWEKIAGKSLARHTQAVKVHEHRLFVKVDSPILRNELTYIKPALIEKIKKEIPESGVEDIDFR
jgi:predicted nucleic acid-binding Zn ribbon protein